MSTRTVVVAHRERLAADAIASALARYPALAPIGVATSSGELLAAAEGADVVAVDDRIPGAANAIRRLLQRGLRVVAMTANGSGPVDDEDDDGLTVSIDAPVGVLAAALAPGSIRPRTPLASRLTSRELEVLKLAAKGLAGKQIARVLAISPKTVEQHKTRTFKKLGVPNQAAAVALLAEVGAA